uniref:Uncharacterized protein n=1 Tax=Lotharella oceanica TaxID=641309 RepID=A0A7S2TL39_9EUKA|mmetsp:Transcript_16439/g.31175  ORF Transcript_16439/g.31175 Transcript_16439/m.31175 type:complete len:270 (+) Transcript_16439:128-937(+)|eukprot:CAMPEP_0170178786 /NCGR_PEP_ID=MMETSP0040_2-20121228/14147_1 /TAXON_ID=641309 /ORGANISM="Lotharella oceanica, Strain CCMP622" /LENGTH=269 /DNA_ID=CAMNT_0010422281 /DNA_START=67 /DNA_END=876 /DNA_ORIENTATION=+
MASSSSPVLKTLVLHYRGAVLKLKVFHGTPASDIEFNIRRHFQVPDKAALKYADGYGAPLALTSFAPDNTRYLVVPYLRGNQKAPEGGNGGGGGGVAGDKRRRDSAPPKSAFGSRASGQNDHPSPVAEAGLRFPPRGRRGSGCKGDRKGRSPSSSSIRSWKPIYLKNETCFYQKGGGPKKVVTVVDYGAEDYIIRFNDGHRVSTTSKYLSRWHINEGTQCNYVKDPANPLLVIVKKAHLADEDITYDVLVVGTDREINTVRKYLAVQEE